MSAGPAPGDGWSFEGVVALDGPSGTGKSTVARRLALRIGARYLDTGAMYRAATLAVLRAGVPVTDAAAVGRVVTAMELEISTDPRAPGVRLQAEDVAGQIRSATVTAAVSAVSALPGVRSQLVARQRALIGAGGVVVEGRDIGSVVCPDAAVKVFLTARGEVRARRRATELGSDADLQAVAADIERRDRLDSSRATSPLARDAGALELDTSDLDIDEVVNRLVDIVTQAVHRG